MVLTPTINIKADNTEDLLNIYGLTLGGPIKSEIEDEMNDIQNNLDEIYNQIDKNNEYNKIMEQYIKQREELFNDAINDVSVYQNKNTKVSQNISDNILTADISTLLLYDAEYKTNLFYIDELLENINTYTIDYSYKYSDLDPSELESKLEEVKKLYVESLDTFDLGEVENIKWILPNERYVTSKFGYRIDPLNTGSIKYHSGTDYRAANGSEVGALFNGTITSCGWSDTSGYYITVQSGDNVKYFICHLSEILVQKGQEVKQYDIIALSGGTGSRSTGPHLHMALYLNGSAYDVDLLFK